MRILLLVDFSPSSEKKVADLKKRLSPPDTIVRVLAITSRTPPSAAELWFDAQGSLEEVMAERRRRTEELALRISAALREKGLTVETAVRTGRRRREAALEARSWHPDMIV